MDGTSGSARNGVECGAAVSPAPLEIVREMTRLERDGIFIPPKNPLPPGQHLDPIRLDVPTLRKLVPGAAGRALGQNEASRVTEVIWSEGGDELSVDPAKVDVKTTTGVVMIAIPVRCDQSGQDVAQIALAVGSPDRSAGMFAVAARRPQGPAAVVDRWADALIALAWGTLVELANSISGTAGRDDSGDELIPGSIVADEGGLLVVPYARHPLGPLLK
jgi:hypothetical protein